MSFFSGALRQGERTPTAKGISMGLLLCRNKRIKSHTKWQQNRRGKRTGYKKELEEKMMKNTTKNGLRHVKHLFLFTLWHLCRHVGWRENLLTKEGSFSFLKIVVWTVNQHKDKRYSVINF